MAKSMALVDNGVVVNILWCSDRESETETLIDTADRPAAIGDSYESGKFYRNGEEVLTPLEEARKQLEEMALELADAKAALELLGVSTDE